MKRLKNSVSSLRYKYINIPQQTRTIANVSGKPYYREPIR